MASGLSSAVSRSDINGLSRQMLHRTSDTPSEPKLKDSVREVSPESKKK